VSTVKTNSFYMATRFLLAVKPGILRPFASAGANVTPAMEEGIATNVWSLEEVTALIPDVVPNRPKSVF
jgi:hypothetical protein